MKITTSCDLLYALLILHLIMNLRVEMEMEMGMDIFVLSNICRLS